MHVVEKCALCAHNTEDMCAQGKKCVHRDQNTGVFRTLDHASTPSQIPDYRLRVSEAPWKGEWTLPRES
jgi:hypothetical protein